jgi:hypothetical protein
VGTSEDTILRYDNAHERHAQDDAEQINFPGMPTLYDQFQEEAEEMTPIEWDWPA